MGQPKTRVQDALVPPEPDGHFMMIALTKGQFTIVDEADAEWIASFGRWHAHKSGRSQSYYAVRSVPRGQGSRHLFMHALIAGRKMADHINRNGLDNRRVNLRAATGAQNGANHGLQSNNTSGYKGVTSAGDGRWRASITVRGRRSSLGTFDDPVDAARAYNIAAAAAFGEYAWLNPVPAPGAGVPHLRPPRRSSQRKRSRPRTNTSGYSGVHWHRRDRKWIARIRVGDRRVHLGSFDDPVEAARAYNRAALEHFGESAWLNPIPEATESAA
jgi:hypothetical protein